jgi:superfamily II DNA or RNA helicase
MERSVCRLCFRDLDLKPSYDSNDDDVLSDFYIPVLSEAKHYRRLAGFFSSTALAAAAQGNHGFILNGGEMDLIASAKLSSSDVEAIKQGELQPQKVISESFIQDLQGVAEEFVKDHVRALAWMVAHKKLTIKIAIPLDEHKEPLDEKAVQESAIFHQKVGILLDKDGCIISFSGSINETAQGWQRNIEEFKVFKGWVDGQKIFLDRDVEKARKYFEGNPKNVLIIDVPTAARDRLIQIAPENLEELQLEKYIKKKRALRLRDYQLEAIKSWENHNFRGFFEMATGTGKTFVALGCINRLQKSHKRLVVIIASPQTHLVEQWIEKIKEWNSNVSEDLRLRDHPSLVCDADNPNWKSQIETEIYDYNTRSFSGDFLSNGFYIHTTHSTLSSNLFIEKMKRVRGDILLIVDEVHGTGADLRRLGLLPEYQFRIGLSATPKRHLDEDGNQVLANYFGETVFKMELADAIRKGWLVPYDYLPYYTELTASELQRYREISRKIAIRLGQAQKREWAQIETGFLEGERANVIANASNKYGVLEEILDEHHNKLTNTLIYCHEKQLGRVVPLLTSRFIVSDTITWEDKTKDRTKILHHFTSQNFDCVVAIRCLDEGVDIPAARTAIIMASTGNPRQYIQRRGRILRRDFANNKDKARIYDIIVIPPVQEDDALLSLLERKIVAKELLRHKEFANIAANREEAIERIKRIADRFQIDLDALNEDYIQNLS